MSRDRVRIIVFGYHTIGYLCLRELIERGEQVSAVVTHRDHPGEHIWFDSVAELARSAGIPVFHPRNPNAAAFVNLICSLQPELIFSFYYRRLLGKELLAIPPLGGINLHGSLLPKYRGRSPVNWVLVNGERQTGVTLHYMTEEADAGDIIAQRPVEITSADTALTLFRKVAQAALTLFQETFPLIKAGLAPRIPQDPAQATCCGGRRPEDGRIEWGRPALALYNLIRAVTAPYPGAFTWYQGKKLYVWSSCLSAGSGESGWVPGTIVGVRDGGCLVATGEGDLLLTQMQLQEEEMCSGEAFADKHGLGVGDRLGEGVG
jgi:methionyl-tRNA formyltransferase